MKADFHRFGTDFGNGELDRQFFQHDDLWPLYIGAKKDLLSRVPHALSIDTGTDLTASHRAVQSWMTSALGHTCDRSTLSSSTAACYRDLTTRVQEDFAVLQQSSRGSATVIAMSVCFPSGWRPETLSGADFRTLHAQVPDFDSLRRSASTLVNTMIERGPLVRFVWTVSADDKLDHHPLRHVRTPFGGNVGFLRVERQISIPFPAVSTALFLIRTYIYPFASLTTIQRQQLREALLAMPETIARYKGLSADMPDIVRLLL